MATYYVRKTGNDGSAGTSAGAAWLTIGKALGAAGIASGDTVYIGPGTYRETVTVAMTSAVAETFVIGDVDGSHTGDAPGPIIWTAYTTSDIVAPANAVTLSLNGKDHLTFQNLIIIGGNNNPSCIQAQTTLASDIKFQDCMFTTIKTGALLVADNISNVAINWTFDRCFFHGASSMYFNQGGAVDYDVGVTIQNCFFYCDGGIGMTFISAGSATGKPGGPKVYGCTFLTAGGWALYLQGGWSTTTKALWYNNLIDGSNGIVSDNATTATEDYNYIFISGTARSNVTAGANSIAGANPSYAPNFSMGNDHQWGQRTRAPFTPLAGSPLLGFGNGTGVPAVDMLNRARPAGGPLTKAVGYVERHNNAAKETGTVQAGSTSIAITGLGDHDFEIPVDAVATVISIYGRYDTNHATTNKPQMILLANNEIGYAGETKTMTVTTDTWEQITFSSFTPSAKGIVKLRLVSRSAAASGKAFFDTLAIA